MDIKLKVLDLFSGIGGFSLGLERTKHYETVAFCEIDQYCKLLLQKHWKGVKIYDNVKEITKERLEADGIPLPDVITGGFPCQSFSVAGKQKGTDDPRYLWPEMFRIIKIFHPKFVIGENVRGIVNIQDGMVFETVCSNLESEGYEVQPFLIPAAGVGAPHRRERIWFIAILENSNDNGLEGRLAEARNEANAGKEPSIDGGEDTDIPGRRSDGAGDHEQPGADGEVQGLRDGHEKESTGAAGVRGLHEGTNVSEGTAREDRNQKDDGGALVQEGQTRIQPSLDRGLGSNQTSSEDHQVRQGDDNAAFNRMETGDENVANTDSKGSQRLGSEHELRNSEEEKQTRRIGWWDVEPDVGRVAHGIPGRIHRLKSLGNSIVPKIAEEIGRAIIKAKSSKM